MSDTPAQARIADHGMNRPASEATAPSADVSAVAGAHWHSRRPIQLIIATGLILIAVVVTVTSSLLSNMRDRDLAQKERTLESLATMLAEQLDRSFQSIDLIQTVVIQQMQSNGVASAKDFEQRMSGYDTYIRLTDLISGLPHIDAIVLTDATGRLINFSRTWPTPTVTNEDVDTEYTEVFRKDPSLLSFVPKPRRSPDHRTMGAPDRAQDHRAGRRIPRRDPRRHGAALFRKPLPIDLAGRGQHHYAAAERRHHAGALSAHGVWPSGADLPPG